MRYRNFGRADSSLKLEEQKCNETYVIPIGADIPIALVRRL
jgi:hypothetical protein